MRAYQTPTRPGAPVTWFLPSTMPDSALQGLKGLAVALMCIDHINKYLYAGANHWMFSVGRVAMPLFVLVLAFNLARPTVGREGAMRRTLARLLAAGLAATPAYAALGQLPGGWWPLNILAALAAFVGIVMLLQRSTIGARAGALCLFVIAGGVVEFWWPVLVLCLACWFHFKRPTLTTAAAVLTALLAIGLINGNQWALIALPVWQLASMTTSRLHRSRMFFYVFYPAHLYALWLFKAVVT